jgi:hypothetical protein
VKGYHQAIARSLYLHQIILAEAIPNSADYHPSQIKRGSTEVIITHIYKSRGYRTFVVTPAATYTTPTAGPTGHISAVVVDHKFWVRDA